MRLGKAQQRRDRGTQMAVAGTGRLLVEVEQNGVRRPNRVAGGVKDPTGEVIGVEVDAEGAVLS